MTSADRPLTFAYTPDPDDAFHYCALQTGRIPHPGLECRFVTGHIRELNESCLRGEYDVCAISSVFYPDIDERYVILGSGASVGRGYGPVLACRAGEAPGSLENRRVGVPGTTTTGYFLLRYFYEGFEPVALPFDQVGDALLAGEIDAGVMIHEELLNFSERPVAKMCCLGARWFEHAALPLPVGLVVARRSLGLERLARIEALLHASMAWALENRAAALAFASRFGRGPLSRVREDFVDKFANRDTLLMPQDVRLGLSALYTKALKRGLIDHLPALRAVQDRTGGFSSFIPWSFKPGNSVLGKRVTATAHPLWYLRIIAVARLLLDNLPHIQSSWFSEDLRTGQLGLLAGADDFGGLLFEENVLGRAGHAPKTSLERTLEAIRAMGFEPAQRNSHYEILARYPEAAAA